MRYLLATEHGHQLYRQCQIPVEPVFGQTVFNRKLTGFHRRGHAAVHREWIDHSDAHPLKLHSHQTATAAPERIPGAATSRPTYHRRQPNDRPAAASAPPGRLPIPFSDRHRSKQPPRGRDRFRRKAAAPRLFPTSRTPASARRCASRGPRERTRTARIRGRRVRPRLKRGSRFWRFARPVPPSRSRPAFVVARASRVGVVWLPMSKRGSVTSGREIAA
jgi:hypothetical protein